jgi:uncharacterized repeat protein (TIGR02059 family)
MRPGFDSERFCKSFRNLPRILRSFMIRYLNVNNEYLCANLKLIFIMFRLKIWLIGSFVLLSSLAFSSNYYISSSSGNDALDGKSESNAWKTVSKVNSMSFLPGDSILFRKGDSWRETLTVPTSGTSASYIVYASYGSGSDPVIFGSKISTGWTKSSGNIWISASTFTNPRADFLCEVFFIGLDNSVTWGVYKSGTAALTSEHDWTWSGNNIYVYSATDPGSKYARVEIPQRQTCIDLNNREFITIHGIDLFFGIYEGITYDWKYPQLDLKGLLIENCEIAYIGGNILDSGNENGFGIDVAYSDMILRSCDIHNCGRRSLSLHVYGSGFTVKNVLIEQNYFHDGYHTTGVDISVGSGSYTASFDGLIIRRNQFYDSPTSSVTSEDIFIQNYNYSSLSTTVNNVYIYSNIFRSPSHSSIMMEGTQSVFIYNNTFYNHNTTKSGNIAHLWIDANNSSVKVKNNIFYTNLANDNNFNGLELLSLTDYKKVDADYNLYYRINNNLRIINYNGSGFTSSQIATVRSSYGWETHSPVPANPMFISAADYHVQTGSPAIASGLAIAAVVTDYDGNTFTNPPNIGCYANPTGSVTLSYVSSSVEDATPSILGINYNLSLANVLPAISAFTVKINSNIITVSKVAISGTKVQLTLLSQVLYGDVITVAYTKPAINPLQTASGGMAVSLTDQTVINNVNPTVPVYLSSVIENAAPDLLIMTYNPALANVLPAPSSFAVTVNSVSRNVTKVAIVNGKVQLTLESAVLKGQAVTVSYSKPSITPLQSPTGKEAVGINAQVVKNNVGTVNTPPVVLVNYENSVFSGFIGGLDASGTYDQNNDNLTFNWIVPSTVPVSSRSSSKINFLAPVLKTSETVVFTLNVSDGNSVQSTSVRVLIQPYQPELGTVSVMRVESDGFIGSDNPFNVLDGDHGTWWSSLGGEHWLVMSLSKPALLSYILLTFPKDLLRANYFDLYASTDNISWDPVLINAVSCSFSCSSQIFEFPLASREIPYSYVKLLVHGNSADDMSYVSELRAFGIQEVSAKVTGIQMILFPNPANDHFRILISEEPPTPYLIKIRSVNGKVVYEKAAESTDTYINLPVSLRSGLYLVELYSGKARLVVNKLVIHELRSH